MGEDRDGRDAIPRACAVDITMILARRDVALLVRHFTSLSDLASLGPQSLGPCLSAALGDSELRRLIQRLESTHNSLHERSSLYSPVAITPLNATSDSTSSTRTAALDLVRVLVTYLISTHICSRLE